MDVYIDFKSPAAYLAVKPTIELARQYQAAISWHPIKTRQPRIPAIQANEDRGATHRRVRAIAREKTFLHYASVQNLDMQFRDDPGSTDVALAALAGLDGNAERFVQLACAAYWTTDKDLDSRDVVQSLLRSAGYDLDIMSLEVETMIKDTEERTGSIGAIDAPAYVVAGELFIGREHLPWITELLRADKSIRSR